MPTDATITGEGIFFIYIFFYLGATYHFRFRHCHSVTRRFSREKGIFFIYIVFYLGRYISLPFPSLSQCHKKVSA